MKVVLRDLRITVSICVILLTVAAGNAFAKGPKTPDLKVSISGPASAHVRSPYVYTVSVSNIGRATAAGVKLYVDPPLTDTSPTRAFLGSLSGLDSRCQVESLRIKCNLGSLSKNASTNVSFNFALPVSTKTLTIAASGSTTGNDPHQGNNSDSVTPALTYDSLPLTDVDVLNSHCTGTSLTSYFECEMFPSSLTSHTSHLEAGGTISFGGNNTTYGGYWNQPTPQQLHFTYTDGSLIVAEFNGYAVSSTCFEGLTSFPLSNGWVSPYKVCIQ